MADGKRFSSKTQIENGTETANLSMQDMMILQHVTGDNSDYKGTVAQIQAIPFGTTDTAAATATKVVTLSNFPADYTPIVGSKVLIHFTNANSASSQIYLTVGTVTAPATCKGFALKSPIPAGAEIEFTYTGSNFNCQDFAISSLDTSALLPVNSSAVNGALANYQQVKSIYTTTYNFAQLYKAIIDTWSNLNVGNTLITIYNNSGSRVGFTVSKASDTYGSIIENSPYYDDIGVRQFKLINGSWYQIKLTGTKTSITTTTASTVSDESAEEAN